MARDICRAVAEKSPGRRVASMTVEVGALAGIAADALEFCISEVAREEGLGDPEVTVKPTATRVKCSCGAEYSTEDILQPCPSCGGYQREFLSGMDIVVSAVELENA